MNYFASKGVSHREGDIAFTLTEGDNSAASETVNPLIAPLAAPIEACIGKPTFDATLENRTTEPLLFFKLLSEA